MNGFHALAAVSAAAGAGGVLAQWDPIGAGAKLGALGVTGALGVGVVALAWWALKQDAKKDRLHEQALKLHEQIRDRLINVSETATKAISDNAAAIREWTETGERITASIRDNTKALEWCRQRHELAKERGGPHSHG